MFDRILELRSCLDDDSDWESDSFRLEVENDSTITKDFSSILLNVYTQLFRAELNLFTSKKTNAKAR